MGLKQIFSTGVYSFYFVFINNSLMKEIKKNQTYKFLHVRITENSPGHPTSKK